MLTHVLGNFTADSGSQDLINKEVTEFKTLKTKAHGRQQEALSSFQNNSLLPQESFFLLAASSLFFLFSPCPHHPAVNSSTIDTAQHRIMLPSAMKEIRNGRGKPAGQGQWVHCQRYGKEKLPSTPESWELTLRAKEKCENEPCMHCWQGQLDITLLAGSTFPPSPSNTGVGWGLGKVEMAHNIKPHRKSFCGKYNCSWYDWFLGTGEIKRPRKHMYGEVGMQLEAHWG